MANDVGEGFLDDSVGGEVHAGWEAPGLPFDAELGRRGEVSCAALEGYTVTGVIGLARRDGNLRY